MALGSSYLALKHSAESDGAIAWIELRRLRHEWVSAKNGAICLTAAHHHNPDESNVPLAPEALVQERYRIVRQLGRGGMGAVYEAVDQRLGKTVALKETLSSDPSTRRQFEREARLLAGMQHQALPQVTDHFVEGNRAFLVMQFIGGVDLAKIITQQPGPFPRDQVIAWADQLLDALIYLHSRDRQVIHRDIKPHNLKLTAGGQIALLDFGLAKAQLADSSITASQSFFGYTRHYAPLEQIQDQRTDPRSDIYALGATLYHLLTGIKPPDAMVRATDVLNGGVDPLQLADKIHVTVGPQIANILNKAMALKPEERYASASDFREALRRIGRTKDVIANLEPSAAEPEGRTIAPTVHVSEITSVRAVELATPQLALVASARRFGPAGATALLALLVTFVSGIVYASQRWFPETVGVRSVGKSSAADSAARQSSAMRTTERSRSEKPAARAKDISETSSANRNVAGKDEVAARDNQSMKRSESVIRPQTISRRDLVDGGARKKLPRVGAPSIRLPNLDVQDHAPSPSPDSRIRTFGTSSAPFLNVSPKFYLAADGTRIVRFPDGSTQYVRPVAALHD